MRRGRWSSTIAATVRPAGTPPMWPASGWGRWARPTTASSVSPACGPTSASTGRSTSSPTPRHPGCPRAGAIRGFGPSRSWPPPWWRPPSRPASGSARWWPTAFTATTSASPRRWGVPGWPLCWRSSLARGLGAGRGGPHPARGRRRARLDQPGAARGLDPGHPPVPRRPHRDLVGGRREPARGRLGPAPAAAAGGGHHRPGQVGEAVHLVPGHQPAPPRRAAGISGSGLRAGRPGRGGAPVQPAQLGRAELQAG
jgi:hypothetical protein